MVDVRPDEVSAILKEQLSNFKSEAELEEVGTVLQIGDGVARIYGLTGVQAGELKECLLLALVHQILDFTPKRT